MSTMNLIWYPTINPLEILGFKTKLSLNHYIKEMMHIRYHLRILQQLLHNRSLFDTQPQSIYTHYSCFKIWAGLWPWTAFLNNNDPVFCNLLFQVHILDLIFFKYVVRRTSLASDQRSYVMSEIYNGAKYFFEENSNFFKKVWTMI